METFFTADQHFDHVNILNKLERPFRSVAAMNEEIIARWNKKVTRADEVYILGDISFSTPERTAELIGRLNGVKFLVTGNHDWKQLKSAAVRNKFVWVKDYHVVNLREKVIVLFHYPIQIWDRQHYGSLHLYGHIHKTVLPTPNSYNVGVDANMFAPVSFDEVLKKMRRD